MRVAYTAGVLDFLLDEELHFPVVATASASSLIGSSYISKQRDRNYKLIKEISNNPESISFKRMLHKKELYGMDYIFDKVPNEIVPLDFDAFSNSHSKFIIGTTNINTGTPIYHDSYHTQDDLFKIIRASCSLPVLASSISYDEQDLMDGGVSDPIPLKPLLDNGLEKQVVVLTRNKGYIKKATKLNWLFKRLFRDKPNLVNLLRNRHIAYNQTMQKLIEMESRNKVFIIQPEQALTASRIERNKQKLYDLYEQGYEEAKNKRTALNQFLLNLPTDYTLDHIPS